MIFTSIYFDLKLHLHYQRFWFWKTQFKCTLYDSTIWQCIPNISSLFYNPFIYKQDLKTNSPNSFWNTANSPISGHPQELDKNVNSRNCLPFKMILTRGKQRNSGQMFAYWRVLYWTLNQQLTSPLANFLSRVVFCWFAHWRQIFLPIVNYYWWGVHLRECKQKQNPIFI